MANKDRAKSKATNLAAKPAPAQPDAAKDPSALQFQMKEGETPAAARSLLMLSPAVHAAAIADLRDLRELMARFKREMQEVAL